jgi:hypothetical protein
MQHGTSQFRLKELRAALGVDLNTIRSWQSFWTKLFPTTDSGKRTRSWFPEGGSSAELLPMLWKRLSPTVITPLNMAIAAVRMLAMVMTDGVLFDEKIINQLSAIAYAQETPTVA